ncbi:MAG: 4Fe-4S ferredoxin [candidate division Zixibacteria bacterium CG_4_9_14_3_um_filter_46_8]|nr:MAG: 4Fe-4S ferredoxin [candidate division Zixibacteria bacterium CG_4_9_14_3_um_filter_46_8]
MAEEKIDTADSVEGAEKKSAEKKKRTNPTPINIYRRWCKGCSICIVLCPQNVFEADPDGYPVVAHPFDCNQCGICWLHCPDFAITSTEK